MWTAHTMVKSGIALLAIMALTGCPKDEAKPDAAPSATPSASAAPSAAASTAPSAAPSASAVPLTNRTDCPKASTGPGTFDHPCDAKGATGASARLMEAIWNGKYDDKGSPQFKVQNKSTQVVLYGRVVAYFYDKAGKQLEVKDANGGKNHTNQACGGNIFGGVMKAQEKAVISFSCLKKEIIPEGTTAIEAEIQTVGFADSTEKKSDYYWKNDDIAPDTRKKGAK